VKVQGPELELLVRKSLVSGDETTGK
jgi:hypothetical protein